MTKTKIAVLTMEWEHLWDQQKIIMPMKKARSLMRKYGNFFQVYPSSIVYDIGDGETELKFTMEETGSGTVTAITPYSVEIYRVENVKMEFGTRIRLLIRASKTKERREVYGK